MKAKKCILLFYFLAHAIASQSQTQNATPDTNFIFKSIKANEKEFKLNKSEFLKTLKITDDSAERYHFSKAKKEITLIETTTRLNSSKTELISFWYLNNQIFKIIIIDYLNGKDNKKIHGFYFYSNDLLIYKEEKNILRSDLPDLLSQSKSYLAKGQEILKKISRNL